MKVIIVYRPNSEFARRVEEFAHEFEKRHNIKPTLIDVDGREGLAILATYDILQHPAILVTREGGELLHHWTGDALPAMGEVASYARV